MTHLINNTLKLTDDELLINKANNTDNDTYNLDYLDTSENMSNIIDVIGNDESVKLCLYGMRR